VGEIFAELGSLAVLQVLSVSKPLKDLQQIGYGQKYVLLPKMSITASRWTSFGKDAKRTTYRQSVRRI
jgi:hypothetical protein